MSKEVNVTVGQRYRNYKNKRVAKVVKVDDTAACADLIYEDGDGKEGARISFASLKGGKSWKMIADNAAKAEEVETAGDGTPMNEVMQEILSDEEKAKKALEEMLAPAADTINEAKAKAKAKVKAEAEAKAEAVKKAEEEEAEKAKAEEAEENALLAKYQKDMKAKKQKKATEAEVKAEKPKKEKPKADKPKKEKKAREPKVKVDVLPIVTGCVKNYEMLNCGRMRVLSKDKKFLFKVCSRNSGIRIYTSDEVFEKIASHTDLFTEKPGVNRKLNKSLYVVADNIKAVLTILTKED